MFPNLKYHYGFKSFSLIKERTKLIPDMNSKVDFFAQVINQFGGLYIFKTVKTGTARIHISPQFLNLHTSGIRYTVPLIQDFVAELEPRSGDSIYSIEIMDPEKNNYWLYQITRGVLDDNGKFAMRPKTLSQFYESYLTMIKNVLERTKNSKDSFFEDHRKALTFLKFKATEEVYKKIDKAIENAIGYPAFICLLGGALTFTKVSNGFQADFLLHGYREQVDLINGFLGRGLHDQKNSPLGRNYFQTNIDTPLYGITYSRRAYYYASLFMYGFKRNDRVITPSNSYFKDNYYIKCVFDSAKKYRLGIEKFLARNFAKYINTYSGERNPLLNKMNIDGKEEIFNFLSKKLESVLDKAALHHEGCKELAMNMLMKRVFFPTGESFVEKLRNILFTGENDVFSLNIGGTRIQLEVSHSDLIEVLTPSMVHTMNFLHYNTKGNYLDFDLVWRTLNRKVQSAYNILIKLLDEAPKSGLLDVIFYSKNPEGFDTKISEKSSYIVTQFTKDKITINPKDSEDIKVKALTMLFWMILEPNIFAVVKLPSENNFLYMDIYGLYDNIDYAIEGELETVSNYEEYASKFRKVFAFSDILHFLAFHNSRESPIINYIMKEFLDFYRSFLSGKKDYMISDLR